MLKLRTVIKYKMTLLL